MEVISKFFSCMRGGREKNCYITPRPTEILQGQLPVINKCAERWSDASKFGFAGTELRAREPKRRITWFSLRPQEHPMCVRLEQTPQLRIIDSGCIPQGLVPLMLRSSILGHS